MLVPLCPVMCMLIHCIRIVQPEQWCTPATLVTHRAPRLGRYSSRQAGRMRHLLHVIDTQCLYTRVLHSDRITICMVYWLSTMTVPSRCLQQQFQPPLLNILSSCRYPSCRVPCTCCIGASKLASCGSSCYSSLAARRSIPPRTFPVNTIQLALDMVAVVVTFQAGLK